MFGGSFFTESAAVRRMTDTGTNDGATTAALVGTTGGAGTTRCAVEMAAILAADGRDVCILDAAFGTQGLADYLPGRLDPDVTALLTDDAEAALTAGVTDLPLGAGNAGVDAFGRVACCPARAPFERLARAKTVGAARRFEERIAEAAAAFDNVLVDTPPVAANQSVAAVDGCERAALVTPATTRGADAVQRMRARLDDVGVGVDAVVATRGRLDAADASLPDAECDPADAPACIDAEEAFAAATATATEIVLDCSLASAVDSGGVVDRMSDYVSR